jgi:hypothetical protein
MFHTLALTLLFTSLLARADVTPSVPGPGIVYTVGGVCHIEWEGDKDSNTVWKDMSIELMSGSNFDMIHLTSTLPIFNQFFCVLKILFSCCDRTRRDRLWIL